MIDADDHGRFAQTGTNRGNRAGGSICGFSEVEKEI
jgi:hypothetical protein